MRRRAGWIVLTIAFAIAAWRMLAPSQVATTSPEERATRVRGTLRSPTGTSLVGTMELLAFDDGALAPTVIAHALALDGRYHLTLAEDALHARYFAVRAQAAGYASAGRQLELVPNTTHTIDLVLAPDPGRVALTARTPTGEPVANAEVVISSVPRSGDRGALVIRTGLTDEHGRFAINDLAPVAATLHWAVRRAGSGRAFGEVTKPRGAAPVEIEAILAPGLVLEVTTRDAAGAAVPGVELALAEEAGPWQASGVSDARGRLVVEDVPRATALGYRTRGHHTLAGGYDELAVRSTTGAHQSLEVIVEPARRITGVVRDARGEPIAQVAINAQAADRDMGSPRRAITAADGSFELGGLRDGTTWDLDARHPSYAPAFAERVAPDTGRLELVLTAGGGLAGRVVDGRAAPYEGIEVYVHRVASSPGGEVGLAELATTTTDAEGRWRIARLGAGSYRVEYRSGVRMQWQPIATRVERAEVVLDELQDLGTATLARGAALEGVVDTEAGAVEVAILPRGQGGAPHALIAQVHHGRFTVAGLAAGDYDITLRDPVLGYSTRQPIALVEGERTRAAFAFAGRAVLSGRVRDVAGRPIARAELDVFAADGGTQARHPLPSRAPDNLTGNRALSDDEGRYAVPGLAPGRYRVRLTTPGAGVAETTLEIAAADTTRDFTLPRPARLELALPRATTIVLVDSAPGAATPIATSATADPQGNAHLDNLPAGSYRVRAIAPGLPEITVSLAEGETRHTTITGGTP